jgi:hypothetical protein
MDITTLPIEYAVILLFLFEIIGWVIPYRGDSPVWAKPGLYTVAALIMFKWIIFSGIVYWIEGFLTSTSISALCIFNVLNPYFLLYGGVAIPHGHHNHKKIHSAYKHMLSIMSILVTVSVIQYIYTYDVMPWAHVYVNIFLIYITFAVPPRQLIKSQQLVYL